MEFLSTVWHCSPEVRRYRTAGTPPPRLVLIPLTYHLDGAESPIFREFVFLTGQCLTALRDARVPLLALLDRQCGLVAGIDTLLYPQPIGDRFPGPGRLRPHLFAGAA